MKILIVGSVGSGKSTYSKKLSKELNIPRYEIDSIVHDDINKIKRTDAEQMKIIDKINNNMDWIIEGILRKHLYYLLDMADKIIFMDIDYKVRKKRIIKRYIKQKLHIESCNYKPTINMLKNMLSWNKKFEEDKKEFIEILKKYDNKLEVVK